ncbi:M20/M25/M40 family metallo-hydrolase [Pyxidicoccus xibeiensis]|uniref:M20/M25/M40 family metallo-hydrolase n=1 Tax=Pyxidicoccus xibeiensis TaxID=2906759 RepID=UPI0020A7620E|nr:M20/M25/M40 family metallo-hydrolase [Pyxidicoccus xibeiensis]MCP3141067.1 M20/M25/M40 family metallo-hydrolase [Pyxidicoccus xibeiensis]
MNMKRLASAVMVLGCVSAFAKPPVAKAPDAKAPAEKAPAAKSKDPEVWITIGSDAVGFVNAALMGEGLAAPARVGEKGQVTALRLPESQLPLVSAVMHNQFHRCGGFFYHGTEAEALAAMNAPVVETPRSLAANYTLDNPYLVNTMQAGLDPANILATITHLSTTYPTRYFTSETGAAAAAWLADEWQGYVPLDRDDVAITLFGHSWLQPSVIATITGTTFPDEIVIVGGHLDSTTSSTTNPAAPGADDDASGIATLTEVLRVAMAQGYRPAKTVKFIAYAAEEVGLRGSQAIAQEHKANNRNVIGVLQLDMTNYKGSTVDVGIISDFTNAAQNTFVTNLIGTYIPGVQWANTQCNYACSDHASWNSAGFPVSMPFEALFDGRNQRIHSAADTLANTDVTGAHALKFAKIASAFVAELAEGTLTITDTTEPAVAITAPAAGATLTGSVSVTTTATDASGISRVEFLVDGAVKFTDTVAPYTFTWDTGATPNGAHTLEARAYDRVNLPATSAIQVTVSNSASVAGYDPALRAPRCFSVSESCDSGALLNGRANLGPEVNFPNTINNSCSDGLSGSYHSDESNDHIKVATVDGTPFGPGKLVRIEATVWCFNVTNDKLDLYYTGNAATSGSPAWTFIATLRPTAKGRQVLSTTYTLPAGAVQAVRARFRYGGSPTACGTSSYNDHDDLVFAVQP